MKRCFISIQTQFKDHQELTSLLLLQDRSSSPQKKKSPRRTVTWRSQVREALPYGSTVAGVHVQGAGDLYGRSLCSTQRDRCVEMFY